MPRLRKDASEFFGDFFVFDGNEARQHFDDRDFGVERAVDRGELDADGTGADDDQRLGNFFQAGGFRCW
jgi:hypothetical protein